MYFQILIFIWHVAVIATCPKTKMADVQPKVCQKFTILDFYRQRNPLAYSWNNILLQSGLKLSFVPVLGIGQSVGSSKSACVTYPVNNCWVLLVYQRLLPPYWICVVLQSPALHPAKNIQEQKTIPWNPWVNNFNPPCGHQICGLWGRGGATRSC